MTGNWTGKKTTQRYRWFSLFLTGIFLFLSYSLPVCAKEAPAEGDAVLFLLDASSSMKENDPERLAVDSIAQFVYTLPTNHKVGFVAYNSEITAECPLVESGERSRVVELAEQTEYTGYSDAGAGLALAAEYLKAEASGCGQIVLFTDGEILTEDEAGTQESRRKYREVAEELGKAGSRVHVVDLAGAASGTDDLILEGAECTGGRLYEAPQASGLQDAVDSILAEALAVRQSTLAIVDACGQAESVSVELPYAYADKVRVLLTGTGPVQSLGVHFQAESAERVSGERYCAIALSRPHGTELTVRFTGTAGSQVRISAVPEYRVLPRAEVVYTDVVPEDAEALNYDRTADITYTFYDLDNPDRQLWTESYFEHQKITMKINGETEEGVLSGGRLVTERTVERPGRLKAEPDCAGLPVNVTAAGEVELELEGPPALPEEEKPSYVPVVAGAGLALALFAIVLALIWQRPRRKDVSKPQKQETVRYSYAGKLNLYIARTPSGCEIPPLSYNLFRLADGRAISLGEVLERCGVTERFAGAETIDLKPGADRSLVLTNNSDGTLIKNREILMKGNCCLLAPGEKVDILSEDETSELMLQYKELTPSERQGT